MELFLVHYHCKEVPLTQEPATGQYISFNELISGRSFGDKGLVRSDHGSLGPVSLGTSLHPGAKLGKQLVLVKLYTYRIYCYSEKKLETATSC